MIASLLILLAPAQPAAQRPVRPPWSRAAVPVEPFDGKFVVVYSPIYCIRAPCPPGRFSIQLPGRPGFSVTDIEYDPATPAAARSPARSADTWPDGLAIDGRVTWQKRKDGHTVAIILARRAIPGRWKP